MINGCGVIVFVEVSMRALCTYMTFRLAAVEGRSILHALCQALCGCWRGNRALAEGKRGDWWRRLKMLLHVDESWARGVPYERAGIRDGVAAHRRHSPTLLIGTCRAACPTSARYPERLGLSRAAVDPVRHAALRKPSFFFFCYQTKACCNIDMNAALLQS